MTACSVNFRQKSVIPRLHTFIKCAVHAYSKDNTYVRAPAVKRRSREQQHALSFSL